MIEILNRYQRTVTIAITICVVTTFIFYGASKAFVNPSPSLHEQVVWTSKDRSLNARQLQLRSDFLACENVDFLHKRELLMSWLNPGFISEWFIQTGVGQWLIEQDPQSLAFIKAKYEQERQWVGYRHPKLAYLNFDAMIEQFNPPLTQALNEWKKSSADELGESLATKKVKLWLLAKNMPFHVLRDLVHYQESAQPAEVQDQNLSNRSMQLFGHQTLENWFGKNFLARCVQTISYGAQEAEELGYEVDQEQITLSINTQLTPVWQKLKQHQPELTLQELKQKAIASCGMNEQEFYSFWKDLLLFDKFFHHEGSYLFTGPLPTTKLSNWYASKVRVDIHQIPSTYQVKNFQDLYYLQTYWKSVCGLDWQDETVPAKIQDLASIAANAPELIAKRVKLAVRSLNLEDCRQVISPKELFTLQANDSVWKQLIQQLPAFALKAKSMPSRSQEERLQLLSLLPATEREHVDKISVLWLIENQPEKVMPLMMAKEPSEQEYTFILPSLDQPLVGISNAREFLETLKAEKSLNLYTQDKVHFYHVQMLSQVQDECLDFNEARNHGVLEALLNKKLQKHYEGMKSKQNPAVMKQGKVLAFNKVRSLVALDFFQPLLLRLQKVQALAVPQSPAEVKTTLDADRLAPWRYYTFMQKKLSLLSQPNKSSSADSNLTNTSKLAVDEPVAAWSLENYQETKSRDEAVHTVFEQAFKLKPGEWLSVLYNQTPQPYLVQCLDSQPATANPYEMADKVQSLLAQTADEAMLLQWIKKLTFSKASGNSADM